LFLMGGQQRSLPLDWRKEIGSRGKSNTIGIKAFAIMNIAMYMTWSLF
jgi:hypothetical protein